MFMKNKQTLLKAQENNDYLNSLLNSEEALRFIKYVIKAYTKSPPKFMAVNKVEWDDLLQAGYIGLFQAIRNVNLSFSPNEWVRYAYLTIQGEIRKFSRSNDSNMVVISQRIRELYPKYKMFHEEFWVENLKDPSIEDTMNYFLISRKDAFDLVYGMQEVIYQEDILNEYEKDSINNGQNVEMEALNKLMFEEAIESVNDVEQQVIYLHYYKGLKKTEVSQVIGCSNSMITKHISSAFKKIRNSKVFLS